MTVYVDELRSYGRRGEWCHMMTDGDLSELHQMAEKLRLRQWFQDHPRHPHYDLVPSKRAAAVKLGAVEVTSKEIVERCSGALKPAGESNDNS